MGTERPTNEHDASVQFWKHDPITWPDAIARSVFYICVAAVLIYYISRVT